MSIITLAEQTRITLSTDCPGSGGCIRRLLLCGVPATERAAHLTPHKSANNALPHSSLCVGHPQYPNTAGCVVIRCVLCSATERQCRLSFCFSSSCAVPHSSDGVVSIHPSTTESNQWCGSFHWLVAVSVFWAVGSSPRNHLLPCLGCPVSAAATDHTDITGMPLLCQVL